VIPFDSLLQAVRYAANRYPDRVTDTQASHSDGNPSYWDYFLDQPGCIVGMALHYSFDIRIKLEHNSIGVRHLNWLHLGFIPPIEWEIRWLELVQNAQDAGMPWRAAITAADRATAAIATRASHIMAVPA
jgi:hypothetical protein